MSSDQKMQDNEDLRASRRYLPPRPGHNRKARRKLAKKHGLFKDRTGGAWRTANNHMKRRLGKDQVDL